MRQDKESAFALRKRGYSYNFIHKKLNLPISTLSDWFSSIRWSQVIKRGLTRRAFEKVYPQLRAMSKARSIMWEKWRERARKEAATDFKKLSLDPLFISGVMIYWGEGDKNPKNPVRISNTDPRMLKIFVKFLTICCRVSKDKIKGYVIIYPDLKEETCRVYWSQKMDISISNFYKTQHIIGRHKTKRLGYGIGVVSVGSRQIKEKILKWIELYSKYNYAGMV